MLDLSQYTFNDTVKEERRPYSYLRAKIVLMVSFLMFFVVVAELVYFLINKFPTSNEMILLIANGVLALINIFMIFFSISTTKNARKQGADGKYSKAGTSIVLLNTIIALSIVAFFVIRIINPEFLPVL